MRGAHHIRVAAGASRPPLETTWIRSTRGLPLLHGVIWLAVLGLLIWWQSRLIWTAIGLLWVGIFALGFLLQGIAPLLVRHSVSRSRIVLRVGLHVRVAFSPHQVLGWRAGVLPRSISLRTGLRGAVTIQLRAPIRVPTLLFRASDRFTVTVLDPDLLLRALEDACPHGIILPAED